MAGETKQVFGSATTVVSVAANMASNYVAGNNTLLDNSTNPMPYGLAVLNVGGGFNVAPTGGSPVTLWGVPQDVDSTSDCTPGSTVDATPAAESGFKSSAGAIPLGTFYVANSTSAQRTAAIISLLGYQKLYCFIKNAAGQQLNAGAGTECTVKITPFTMGPA